ncbi:MAG: glycosyltransferase, partial [Alphaproteobacteria bacterium]
MQTPIVSVLVPTRERANTLKSTLASALDQKSPDYEVVVSDNCSQDDTAVVVAGLNDPRVQYFKTSSRLSMCDNYEFALEKARGTYVIIIGDDDAIIPGALDELIATLKAAPTPTIHMWPLHTYDWPTTDRPARADYLAPRVAP